MLRSAPLAIDLAVLKLIAEDPSIAAQMANGMINAVAEIERWVQGIDASNTFDLYAMPLFTGLLAAPPARPAQARTLTARPRRLAATP